MVSEQRWWSSDFLLRWLLGENLVMLSYGSCRQRNQGSARPQLRVCRVEAPALSSSHERKLEPKETDDFKGSQITSQVSGAEFRRS